MADDSLLSAEQKFALIEAVRVPLLYDKINPDYHNKEKKDRVWAKIAEKAAVQLECSRTRSERCVGSLAPDDNDGQQSDASTQGSVAEGSVAEDYAVEQVLDERWVGGQRQYLLQWVGDHVPTWEPASNVDNCEGLLAEFNEDLDPGVDEDIGSD